MSTHQTHGELLLIGGAPGVGKTSVAQELGLRLGRSWLYVDEVRLAFQRSHVTLPEKTEALYFFERPLLSGACRPSVCVMASSGVQSLPGLSYHGTHLPTPC